MDTSVTKVQNNLPTAPADNKPEGSGHPGFFHRVTDKVLIPAIALGLSTPVLSQAICLVGSKILKHKMERETESMMSRVRVPSDSNNTQGNPISLTKDEEDMRKAEMAAIKEHFKRRKEDAKVQRKLLKGEKAAMRKSEAISSRKLEKGASPPFINPHFTDGTNPPTYLEAIKRFENPTPDWEHTSIKNLPPHSPGDLVIQLNPAPSSTRSKFRTVIGWVQEKKAAACHGCKLGDKKAVFKSKLKVNKKAGLILGFGWWGNY